MPRIHLFGFRVEDQVSACFLYSSHIVVQITWISLQILIGSELNGVHKHGYHRAVILACRLTDKTLMSLMQKAHRGHQSYCQPFFLPGCYDLPNFFYGLNYLHVLFRI